MRRKLSHRFTAIDLPALARKHRPRVVYATFGLLSCGLSIALLASIALWVGQPLVFPSLGPTAFLIYDRPRVAAAAPRNVVLGHLTGVLVGVGCLRLFDLQHQGPALHHVTAARVGAVGASLGLTVATMIIGRVPHPPATATTLVISLGLITSATGVVALMVGVVLLAAQGVLIDRVVGINYPLWASSPASPTDVGSPGPPPGEADNR